MKADGFATHASGLLVPEEFKREREVWTRDEGRLLDRFIKLAEARGLAVFLGCPESGCEKTPVERIRNLDGGITLRCQHKDRVFQRTF